MIPNHLYHKRPIMDKNKRLFISLTILLLLPLIVAAVYLLIQGTMILSSKVDLITFCIFYLLAVPIGAVIIIKYYKNKG